MFDFKICVFFVIVFSAYEVCGKNVICYYGSWATYRNSTGKFDVSNINVDLCTHVVYSFAGLQSGKMVSLDAWLDLPDNGGRNNFADFVALKSKNPKLKTILAVGGWNEGSSKFSVMASTAANRKIFIDSAVSIISTHGFDGLDLDWEYPNRRDTVYGQADVNNFSLLIKELREAFEPHGWFLSSAVSAVEAMAALSYDIPEISKDTRDVINFSLLIKEVREAFEPHGWFLSSAVSAVGAMAALSYDIPEISKYLDMINIMAYDMHGAWDPVTGHNAPLHRGTGGVGDATDLYTVDVALQYWIKQGAPLEKLALGVPFYGRSFKLSNPNFTSVGDPASGPGIMGPYTLTNGSIGYNEFCIMLQSEPWTQEYDALAMVPYAYSGSNWVSYDDDKSITIKVEYAKSLGINNIMMWSIETDDFHGMCGNGDWPLLRAINNALDSTSTVTPTSTEASISTQAPTTTSPTSTQAPTSTNPTSTQASTSTNPTSTQAPTSTNPTSTQAPTSTNPTSTQGPTTTTCPPILPTTTRKERATLPTCTKQGSMSNPSDCGSFYMCVTTIDGGLEPTKLDCPASLHYDSSLMACSYPELANCTEE